MLEDHFFYHVNYHADCERCGKRFDGVILRGVKKNDSNLLGDTINAFADSVDGMNARKFVEARVEEQQWSELRMPYGPDGHSCPYCGARQSWDPPFKPKEPEMKQTTSSKTGSIGCAVAGCGIAGVVLGLIAYLIQSFAFYENDPLILMIFTVVGIVAGVILGLWSNKKTGEEMDETYSERLKSYHEYLDAYNAFQDEVALRPMRNMPIVDFSTGGFSSSEPTTAAQTAGTHLGV